MCFQVQDVATLGVVNVRYCGYIAVVRVQSSQQSGQIHASYDSSIFEQPEGGANALNINRFLRWEQFFEHLLSYCYYEVYCLCVNVFFTSLRMLLHKKVDLEANKLLGKTQSDELRTAQVFVHGVLEKSLSNLGIEDVKNETLMRWELGACWMQHLQEQKTAEKDKKQTLEKNKSKSTVEGLGKPLKFLKSLQKKSEEKQSVGNNENARESENSTSSTVQSGGENKASDCNLALEKLLSDSAFARLKQSETGLHAKVYCCEE